MGTSYVRVLALAAALWLAPPALAGLESGRTAGRLSVGPDGSAQIAVPLAVTPGIGGLTPRLALTWSSRQRQGSLGHGWDLAGLGAITRCARTWAQDGAPMPASLAGGDAGDRFCLDGQRLRRVAGIYGGDGTLYQTELESFVRITSWGVAGTGPKWFTVEQPDGTMLVYGGTEDSRIEAAGSATVREWALSAVHDRNRNGIRVTYAEEGAPLLAGMASQWGYRPLQVRYTEGGNGEPAHHVINFQWTQLVAPAYTRWVAGTLVADHARLASIEHRHDGALVRRWTLGFNTGSPAVAQVTECGPTRCREPLTAEYRDAAPGLEALQATGDATNLTQPDASMLIDVDGDGRDDFVSPTAVAGRWSLRLADASSPTGFGPRIVTPHANTNSGKAVAIDWDADGRRDLLVPLPGPTGALMWSLLRSTGTTFEAPVSTGYPADFAGTAAVVTDVNGDGRDDLVYGLASPARVMARLHDGVRPAATPILVWSAPAGATFCADLAVGGQRQDLSPYDFDGDGRGDLLACTSSNTGRIIGGVVIPGVSVRTVQALVTRGTATAPAAQSAMTLVGQAATVVPRVGDFNGDGMQDLLYRTATGTWEVRAYTGLAFAAPVPGRPFTAAAVLVDHDGDGTTDLLDVDAAGQWRVAYGRGALGSAFQAPDPAAPALAGSDTLGTAYRVGDVDGDGSPDLVGTAAGDPGWHLVRRARAARELVTVLRDGAGIETRVTYGTAAADCQRQAGRPAWPQRAARLSAPVCRAEVDDGVGGVAATRYAYVDPRVDVARRQWLGIARRDTIDERRGHQWVEEFHQAFPLAGLPSARRAVLANGVTPLVEETWSYAVTQSGVAPEIRQWPQLVAHEQRDRVLDGPRAGAPQRQILKRFVRDAYGGVTQQSVQVTDEDALSPGLGEVHRQSTTRTFQHDPASWCLGLPVREVSLTTAPDGSQRQSATGQSVDVAKCRVVQRREEPAAGIVSRTIDLAFDACGNVVAGTLTPAGLPARTERAEFGSRCALPEARTDALGFTTRTTWRHDLGLPVSVVDPNGLAVATTWDEFGERTQVRAADGSVYRERREACGAGNCVAGGRVRLVTAVLGADASVLGDEVTVVDAYERPIWRERRAPLGARIVDTQSYDRFGQLATTSFPSFLGVDGRKMEATFDEFGRIASARRPRSVGDATPVVESYERDGAMLTAVDAAAGRTVVRVDALGRVRTVTDPLGGRLTYAYGAFGVTSVTDAVGAVTRMTYDAAGRRATFADATTGTRTSSWDALDQLVSETDAKGQVRSFAYDLLGRKVRRTEPEGVTTWAYGSNPLLREVGQLVAVDAAGYAQRTTFDALGRPSRVLITTDRADAYDYTYDAAGRLDVLAYPASSSGTRLRVRHAWDGDQLVGLVDADVASRTYWQARAFDALGRVMEDRLGNGVVRARSTDGVTGLPDWLEARRADGAKLQDVSLSWDVRGLPTARTDRVTGSAELFSHDALGRLVSTSTNGANTLTASYDAAGNLQQRSDIGVFRYAAGQPHRLLQAGAHSYAYDANGNVSARDGAAIDWTSFDLPSVVRGLGQSSRYTYGPDREVLTQTATFAGGSESTRRVGGLVERVVTTTREHQRHVVMGAEGPVAWVVRRSDGTADTWYATEDALGSLDSLSDAAGTVTSRLRYAPFGGRRSATGAGAPSAAEQVAIGSTTRTGFGLHDHADNVGLVHFGGRVLDPETGRFLSADPVIGSPLNTQDWNRYSYAWNSPLAVTDPTGLVEWEFDVGIGVELDGYTFEIGNGGCVSTAADCANRNGLFFTISLTINRQRYFYDWDDPKYRQGVGLGVQRRVGVSDSPSASEKLDDLQAWLNIGSAAAGVTGGGEVVSVPLDAINACISVCRGRFDEAGDYMLTMVPVAGNIKSAQMIQRSMARWKYRSMVEAARESQLGGKRYGFADDFYNVTLPKNTLLFQLGDAKQPGNFFFVANAEKLRGMDARALHGLVQVAVHDVLGPRMQVQVYQTVGPVRAAIGIAVNNAQHGMGGFGQYFIIDTTAIRRIDGIGLK